MKLFKKRKKKNLTYIEAHNKAFSIFLKASTIMIWAAVFNVFGVLLTIIQYTMNQEIAAMFVTNSYLYANLGFSTYQYSLCYSTNSFIFRFLEILADNKLHTPIIQTHWFYIIIIAIAIVFAAVTAYFAILTRSGKKWAMLTNAIFYGFDTMMIAGCYIIGEDPSYIWIMIGIHIIILCFVAIGIIEYFHLFEIEKAHDRQIMTTNIEEITIGEDENGNI